MGNRIKWLDIAKGIGIVSVFLGHTLFKDEIWRIWIYSFHMPLFFFLSGITYNEIKYDKIKKLLIVKSKSILIPYIVLCAIELIDSFLTLLYKSFCGEKNTYFILIKKIIGILIGLRGTEWYCAFWFLLCIFVVYVFLYVIIDSARRIKKIVFFLSVLLAIVGIVYARLRLPYLPWAIDIALVAVVFTALGWETKMLFVNRIDSKSMLLFAVGSIGFSLLNYYKSGVSIDMYSNRYGYGIFFVLSAVSGISFIIAVAQRINGRWGGILEHIGKNSLYYYGMNVLTLKIVGILTFGLLNDTGSEGAVLGKCLVKVCLAIGISRMFLPGFNMARNFLLDIIEKMEKRSKIK